MTSQATNLQFCDGGDVYQPNSKPDIGTGSPHNITDSWGPTNLRQPQSESWDRSDFQPPQRERWDLNDLQQPQGSLELVDKYQILPNLDDDEYQALKNDIKKHGVLEPVIVDDEGNVIDGRHRVRVCQELGYSPEEIPRRVRRGLDEKEKRELAYRLNLQRRHLNAGQKREIAKQYLKTEWDGEATEKEVANILGVGKTTVHRAKESLRADGKLVHLDIFSTFSQKAQIYSYLKENPDASDRDTARNIRADITHPTVSKRREEMETGDGLDMLNGSLDSERWEKPTREEFLSNAAGSSSTRPLPTTTDDPHPESDEKATPRDFFEPIEKATDGFDLDPASGAEDEPLADTTYTIEDNGLSEEWFGDVWINPPFSQIDSWVDKIETEIDAGRVNTVVLLCHGDNSTTWWQKGAEMATLIVGVDHRLKFEGYDSAASFPIQLMIFGPVTPALVDALADQGLLLRSIEDVDSLTE